MKKINELIKTKRIYFDGATGSLLIERGLPVGTPPEEWNISHPDAIVELHREYLSSGADIIKSNTFGINPLKYTDYDMRIKGALALAQRAKEGFSDKYIALDIGPLGRLISPLGTLDFEDAVSAFRECAASGASGADLILLETFTDLYELKAAVIGVREACSLPIFVTCAFDARYRLMTGADVSTVAALLDGLSVDAIGINCSFGPDRAYEVVKELSCRTSLPIIANPNAGLPTIKDGKVVYNVTPCEFSDQMMGIAEYASILGGCCGTSPQYIRKLRDDTCDIPLPTNNAPIRTTVSSYAHAHDFGDTLTVIGERINPTGKPKLKEALRLGNYDYLLREAVAEERNSHLLDVNAGLPGIDEKKVLSDCVREVQSVSSLPLSIDTSNTEALEAAVRIYNGKPLVNSVNGKRESMAAVFPIVKKYGAVVVALTLDESGIPDTAEGRVEIAEKIIRTAGEYGIEGQNIIVDPLTLSISADPTAARTTLRAVELLTEKGIKTLLGVSNVSFGLPSREKINSVFLADAMSRGLSSAIMNPNSTAMTDTVTAHNALFGYDVSCKEYIEKNSGENDTRVTKNDGMSLADAIKKGMAESARDSARALSVTMAPLDIINSEIVTALDGMGRAFERGEAYLPELLSAAEAASAAFDVIKEKIPKSEGRGERIILATVKGDIHDIGKNIVRVMLESYGFECIDLGRDVSEDDVVEAVKTTGARLVGLSALMTTTVPSMERCVKLLKEQCEGTSVMVGGAVLTPEYASEIGADFYGKDAIAAVRIAEELFRKKK